MKKPIKPKKPVIEKLIENLNLIRCLCDKMPENGKYGLEVSCCLLVVPIIVLHSIYLCSPGLLSFTYYICEATSVYR